MATLVSPGVSVTVSNESFYVPAASTLTPLFFIATREEKTQPNGLYPAIGTYEHGVVRTITSIKQSIETYGTPVFLTTSTSSPSATTSLPYHGDSRNEYGLLALNQYLSVGNRAYVVRAHVNLLDDLPTLRTVWDSKVSEAQTLLGALATDYINNYNSTYGLVTNEHDVIGDITLATGGDGYLPGTHHNVPLISSSTGANATATVVVGSEAPNVGKIISVVLSSRGTGYTENEVLTVSTNNIVSTTTPTPVAATVTVTSILNYRTSIPVTVANTLAASATQGIWEYSSFTSSEVRVLADLTPTPQLIYSQGYDNPASATTYLGLFGAFAAAAAMTTPQNTELRFDDVTTLTDTFTRVMSDEYPYTLDFMNLTTLGSTDSQRRAKIVAALRAEIVNNLDVRSETYPYNLAICPGYYETTGDLVGLRQSMRDEVFIISDTPMMLPPSGSNTVSAWAQAASSTSVPGLVNKTYSEGVAYYYPSCAEITNIDGQIVVGAGSGIALKSYAYNDEAAFVSFAPAGSRRGTVTGVTSVGYVKGTIGTTQAEYVPVTLDGGSRDVLYETNINPITYITGRGLMIMGQKTSTADASARDRVNVERLIGYIRRQLRMHVASYLFEPNDQITRDNVHATVNGFLASMIARRALYDYVVLVNETNNTPDRIDRNELWVDVALKPVKAIEFIYIPIRIVSTGAVI